MGTWYSSFQPGNVRLSPRCWAIHNTPKRLKNDSFHMFSLMHVSSNHAIKELYSNPSLLVLMSLLWRSWLPGRRVLLNKRFVFSCNKDSVASFNDNKTIIFKALSKKAASSSHTLIHFAQHLTSYIQVFPSSFTFFYMSSVRQSNCLLSNCFEDSVLLIQ